MFTNKTKFPLKKCQFECIVYKVEEHNRGSNDGNVSKNVKSYT